MMKWQFLEKRLRQRLVHPLYWLLLISCVARCGGPSSEDTQGAPAFTRNVEGDRCAVKLELDRLEMATADSASLRLEARFPEGWNVDFPDFGGEEPVPGEDQSQSFTVDDHAPTTAELTEDGRVRVEKRYELEPFLPGTYTIPALTVRFSAGKGQDTKELTTEPIEVEVLSSLDPETGELDIKPISPPVALPESRNLTWLWLLLVAAVLLAAGAFLVLRNRRGTQAVTPARPGHEVALERLEQLRRQHLIEQGQLKEFYFRISSILRRYLEDGLGLHAPERTTEEFLNELSREEPAPDSIINAERRVLLRDFLRHCDLVKFAKHEPSRQEIDGTFAACERFIRDTASAQRAQLERQQDAAGED